jgi:hypothetical protein
MSRLHAFASTAAEVASHFGVEPIPSIEMPVETVEGLPGLVVFESGGKRHLRTMIWGFPPCTRAARSLEIAHGERLARHGDAATAISMGAADQTGPDSSSGAASS